VKHILISPLLLLHHMIGRICPIRLTPSADAAVIAKCPSHAELAEQFQLSEQHVFSFLFFAHHFKCEALRDAFFKFIAAGTLSVEVSVDIFPLFLFARKIGLFPRVTLPPLDRECPFLLFLTRSDMGKAQMNGKQSCSQETYFPLLLESTHSYCF
jgi:hypothetical protein